MKKMFEDLERDDLVEPTHSNCAAPLLPVLKKNGTYRLVADYSGLNKQIEKTCCSLTLIKVIDALESKIYFWNIDLLSGYIQMTVEDESQNLTAFITPLGLYKWKRLPLGLASAAGVFRNPMNFLLLASPTKLL